MSTHRYPLGLKTIERRVSFVSSRPKGGAETISATAVSMSCGTRTPAYADRGPIRKRPKSVVFVARFEGYFRPHEDGTSDFWPFSSARSHGTSLRIRPTQALVLKKISSIVFLGCISLGSTPFLASQRDIFVRMAGWDISLDEPFSYALWIEDGAIFGPKFVAPGWDLR